jgi:hypothetical protein
MMTMTASEVRFMRRMIGLMLLGCGLLLLGILLEPFTPDHR